MRPLCPTPPAGTSTPPPAALHEPPMLRYVLPPALLALALALTHAPSTRAAEPDPKAHWAFKAPVRPKVPADAPNPIDAFIRAKLAKEGLKPAPEADKVTLCRRLY